jgi:thioredoxin-like negative regulator of GroEL
MRAASALLGVLVVSIWPAAAAADTIEWETRLDRGRGAALAANRPMLLEFWAAWCAPCKVMDAQVYSDPRVAAAMRKVLPVRLDVDLEQTLSRKYDVQGTPTLIFTDSRGNELFRYQGLLLIDQMLQLLEALPGDVTRINVLAAALEKDENDFAALEGLGRELRAAALYRASNQYYQRALRTSSARQRAQARAGILREIGRNYQALQQPEEAAKAFSEAETIDRR